MSSQKLVRCELRRKGAASGQVRFVPLEIFGLWEHLMTSKHQFEVSTPSASLWLDMEDSPDAACSVEQYERVTEVTAFVYSDRDQMFTRARRYFPSDEAESLKADLPLALHLGRGPDPDAGPRAPGDLGAPGPVARHGLTAFSAVRGFGRAPVSRRAVSWRFRRPAVPQPTLHRNSTKPSRGPPISSRRRVVPAALRAPLTRMCRTAQAGTRVATPSSENQTSHPRSSRGERAARGSMGLLRDRVGSLQGELNRGRRELFGQEINAKLVYYGAGLCGKTTNLEAIYEAVPDTSRSKMVSMNLSDRTLFFDLLPSISARSWGSRRGSSSTRSPAGSSTTRRAGSCSGRGCDRVRGGLRGRQDGGEQGVAREPAREPRQYNINLDSIPWSCSTTSATCRTCIRSRLNAELNPSGRIPRYESVAREGRACSRPSVASRTFSWRR